MRKKKKDSICVVYEGYREGYILEYLAENSKVKLNPKFCSGGSANSIVITAIQHSAHGGAVYAFFDEDFELDPNVQIADETFKTLARLWGLNTANLKKWPYRQLQNQNVHKRNPILVVSNPVSIEGLILQIHRGSRDSLEKRTTTQLKNALDSLIDRCALTGEDVEAIRAIDEKIKKCKRDMQHALSPENKKYLQNEITKWDRKKSKVKFMCFLHQDLPISKIENMRNEAPEIDILMEAFQL